MLLNKISLNTRYYARLIAVETDLTRWLVTSYWLGHESLRIVVEVVLVLVGVVETDGNGRAVIIFGHSTNRSASEGFSL